MNTCKQHLPRDPAPFGAFTLIEVLLATAMSAIVLAGIGGVFFSAMRLRERTASALDQAAPLYQAWEVIRRDLRGALPPGVTAGDFIAGVGGNTGMGQGVVLQFSTTTGHSIDHLLATDVQEVFYELRPSTRRTGSLGQDLVRSVNRNLLVTGVPETEDQVLMERVESVEVTCFNGTDWRTMWDTSLTETNLPVAVRVRIQPEIPRDMDRRGFEPYELVVPLSSQVNSTSNSVSTAESQEATQP